MSTDLSCGWAQNPRSTTQTRVQTRPTKGNFGLVIDYGDHISETRHDTHSEVMAYLRNGFTYGLLERAGYTQGQLDGLEADAFRALLADSGLTTHVIEGGD